MITRKRIENAFMIGLALIVLDVAAYLINLKHAGIAFCIGLFICLCSCLVSIACGEKAKKEDVAALVVGILVLSWLAVKNL